MTEFSFVGELSLNATTLAKYMLIFFNTQFFVFYVTLENVKCVTAHLCHCH